MEIIKALVILLAGMGVFLFGLQIMSDGLEKSAAKKIRKLFSKISNNRMIGVGIGTAATAVIQSSTAVSVMTVGFVNAGIMSLFQATAIIMGANIGTSVDSLLYAMKDLPISEFFMLLAFVGFLMKALDKKGTASKVGEILIGLGLIFVGLNFMSDGFKTEHIKSILSKLFATINSPFALILLGMVITAIVHSSGLITAIVIGIMGIIDPISGFYIVMGSNIGTCFTAVIAAIGTSTNAKRTAFIHIFFNIIGVALVLAFMLPFEDAFARFFTWISGGRPEWQIAWFNIFFNISTTLVFLPFIKQIVWASTKFIKEGKATIETKRFKYLDERILSSPTVAIEQVLNEIIAMTELAEHNFDISMSDVILLTEEHAKELEENEEQLNFLNREISAFMIRISSSNISLSDEALLGTLYHVVSDIERIGDHAENFSEAAQLMINDNISFSDEAIAEIKLMYEKVKELFGIAKKAFQKRDVSLLSRIAVLEQEIDDMKIKFSDSHISRLHSGNCTVESGAVFYEITTNLERVADHLTNIAYSIRSYKQKMAEKAGKTDKNSGKGKTPAL